MPLDLPNQPSSSSTLVPPIQLSSSPTPGPSALASSGQTVTLSTEFLQTLLTQAFTAAAATSSSSTQTVAQPSVTASTNESATPPPFVAAPTAALPLGTSIFDRFPLVDAATILEITQHDFKPMDLFKLDPAAQDKNLERKATLEVEGGILTATPRSGSLRDYPTLSSLLEPLLTYFSILTAYAASLGDMLATLTIANGCNAYTGHLLALSRQFQWSAVLQYHKSYFLSCRREMARGDYSGWSRPDILLMTEHVYGHPRVQNHPSLSRISRPASNSAKQPVTAQTCFAFNKGACNLSPCPNGRVHKCQKCKGTDHGASSCNKSS
jgi:hypothetical protein